MKKLQLYFLNFLLLFLLIHNTVRSQTFIPDDGESGIMAVKPKTDVRAYAFDLKDVRLLNSPFKVAMDADMRYLLELKPDRFLAHFRTHAGLKAKDSVYGGWESEGLAGHSLGHYLSACSLAYASTGDKRFLDKINYTVSQLALCQKLRKSGYIGAIPDEDSIWAQVARGEIRTGGFDLNGGWSPWYTVHKIMAGLLDAYIRAGNKEALEVEEGMADWTYNEVKNLDFNQMQKMLVCEYGGMNEVLANTYAVTGNKKYLELAYRFYDTRFLDSLAAKRDVITHRHANTEIPKIVGCARIFELTNDPKMGTISNYFWNTVIHNYMYAPGGVGNYEYFGVVDEFPLSNSNMESCPSYNLLKLTTHLFALNPQSYYMDYYERDLYNHILATQNHETGMMDYFTPLAMGSKKEYGTPFNTFTCCNGTGMEDHVKYGKNIYYHGQDGSLYINLFIPSVLTWKNKGITIRQETRLPETDTVQLTIDANKPVRFVMRIRRPSWVWGEMKIIVNGTPQTLHVGKDGYAILNRSWKNKDKIEVVMPMRIHKESMPENPERIALFYGPELLSGDFGNQEPNPVNGVPVFVTGDTASHDWIKRTSDTDTLIFHPVNVSRFVGSNETPDVVLIPFNQTGDQYYTVYWDEFTPAQWVLKQKQYEDEKKKEEEIRQRTVDVLRLGEMQPERDHVFNGEKIYTGNSHTKSWRAAGHGGKFSFEMKVDSLNMNQLICTYWGMDNRGRIFDISVDGVKVARVDLNEFKESRFYDITYDIPDSMTKGKEKVNLTFQAIDDNNSVGPVYGVRMVRKKK